MSQTDPEARILLCTAPDMDTARALARGLVGERLAACCNLVGGVASIYRWEGALEETEEVLLVIKTSAERVPALREALLARHPYDVPELVSLRPDAVAPRYLDWLLAATGGAARS